VTIDINAGGRGEQQIDFSRHRMKADIRWSAIRLIEEIAEVLGRLTDHEYCEQLTVLSNATIGQHVRHIAEFFQAIAGSTPSGQICYDNRRRSTELEVDRLYMISTLADLRNTLGRLNPETPVTVQAYPEFETMVSVSFQSTTGREILFAFEHSIHHLALIRIGIEQNFAHVRLPENFGIAPTTVRFRKSLS
jgi:hypothetical protein